MTEKIFGYLLIISGLIIIILSALSVYRVFTKKAQPIQLFNFPGISFDLGQSLTQNLSTQNLPAEIKQLLPQQSPTSSKTEIISSDMLNTSSNIFAQLILMGFMASIGFKIASLGVMLVRPIVVKLKAKEETPTQSSPPQTAQ